jgi:hypothetical protein
LEDMRLNLKIRAIEAANKLESLGQPEKGEGLGAFLRRCAKKAHEKKDWPRLQILLAVYYNATGGGCARNENMQEGVRAYLAAGQLEKAGLYRDAVRQYTLCITQLGTFVPGAEATEALNRLRKEHPEAFTPSVDGQSGQ